MKSKKIQTLKLRDTDDCFALHKNAFLSVIWYYLNYT